MSLYKLPFGLAWRLPLYAEYIFYVQACKNYRKILRYRRAGQSLDQIELRNGITIKIVGPTQYFLDVFREIYQREAYVKGIKKLPMKVIVDIGAHAGLFSLQAASLWPQAKIHAFEPAPENYSVLSQNISINHISNISAHQMAVSTRGQEVDLFVKQQSECHTIYDMPTGGQTKDIVQVKCIDLQEILNKLLSTNDVIDFLKIDCEGCEYEIMPPAIALLGKRVKRIGLEYHLAMPEWCPQSQLMQPLIDIGFDVVLKTQPRGQVGYLRAINRTLLD